MEEDNAFEKLKEELESKFDDTTSDKIKGRLIKSIAYLGFIGELLELFFTNLMNTLIGKKANHKNKKNDKNI